MTSYIEVDVINKHSKHTLTKYQNVNYDKIVELYYSNADDVATPLTIVQLGYQNAVPNTNGYWENWFASTPNVNLDGIERLLNLTYQATDVSKTYSQQLNIKVTPSGPAPSTSTIPAPYASPTGFASDITDWLSPIASSEAAIAKQRMLANIHVSGSANGTVIAAQSYTSPDYAYHWVRDSSLTMDVVQSFYGAATGTMKSMYESLLFQYATARAQEQNDADLITGLGEPKFNLNNSAFTGPWGRPQNDGPATAAITLMEFSNAYIGAGGNISMIQEMVYDSNTNPMNAPLLKDLIFVAQNWTSPSFDLWEEEQSDHFYTRMVQYRSLLMGTVFSKTMGDTTTSQTLAKAAAALAPTLKQFWDPIRGILLYEYGPVLRGKYTYEDTAVILGLIHGYAGDGTYSYSNDQVLASAVRISTSFLSVFPIASTHVDSTGLPLGIPVGRYPEDVYNGDGTSQGNPWYLCMASMAEFMYRASTEFNVSQSIAVSNTSLPFWNYYAGGVKGLAVGQKYSASSNQYQGMIAALQGWGDAYIRVLKYHTPADGHLSEEIDRTSGQAVGAADLTWSYAALLTASFARATAMGDVNYLPRLAAL